MASKWMDDQVFLNVEDASIAGVDTAYATDAIVYGATPRAIDRVVVGGKTIVENGRHLQYSTVSEQYRMTLKKLGLIK